MNRDEQQLVETLSYIADRVRSDGLLANERHFHELDLDPTLLRALDMMVDGWSFDRIEEVLDAAFVEQRHQLERKQLLLKRSIAAISDGESKHVVQWLLKLLSTDPSEKPTLRPSPFTDGVS